MIRLLFILLGLCKDGRRHFYTYNQYGTVCVKCGKTKPGGKDNDEK